MKRKLLSIVLALTMALGMLPAAALADGEEGSQVEGGGQTTYVAQIGSTGYASLADAIAAAKDGDTVKLLQSCNGNGIQIKTETFATNGLTVDFGGNTYTVGGVLVGSAGTGTNAFQLLQGGKVTFKNGSIVGVTEGTKPAEDTPDWHGAPAIMIQNYCDLTLKNMTVTGGDETVYTMSNNHGDVVIDDSTITAGKAKGYPSPAIAFDVCGYSSYDGISVTVKGSSTINGDIEVSRSSNNAKDVKLALEGGTINGGLKIDSSIKPGDATAITKTENVILDAPSGYVWDGTGKLAKAVAQIGDTSYASLADAIDAAQDGDTVKLLDDQSNYRCIDVTKNITIDLNGKTVTNSASPMFSTTGEVTIQNGTITSSSACAAVSAYNKLTLSNVTITGATNGRGKNLVNVCSEAEVTIDKDTVISAKGDGCAVFVGEENVPEGTKFTLNIYGKVTQSGKSYAISGNGSYRAGYSCINIYEGAEVRSPSCAIYQPQAGEINAYGGLVEGYCAIGMKSGTLNISGGTVRGTANDNVLGDGNSNGNGMSYDGSAIVIDSRSSGYDGNVKINITGGTVESCYSTAIREIGNDSAVTQLKELTVSGGSVLSASQKPGNVEKDMLVRDISADSISVSGGTFSSAVDPEYCADGFIPKDNGDGTYGVTRPSSSSSSRYNVTAPKADHGTVTVTPSRASKGDTVTVTVKPDSGYVLETLTVTDKNGNELTLKDKGDGKYTFTMPRGAVTVKATFMEDNTVLNFFYDVPNDAYYYEAVKWAVEKGITSGIGNDLFGSNDPCTRAQIVTFLWRAAGSPEPKALSSFTDVPADTWYAKAVAWAVENGVTAGVGDGLFGSDDTCTRAQSVTFLFKALKAAAKGEAGFRDVASSDWFAQAVAWAVENGVTAGVGGGLFGSGDDCTRAQIVTFLFKAYQGK